MDWQRANAESLPPNGLGETAEQASQASREVDMSSGNMLAHISMRGDVIGRIGDWLGEAGSRLAIEALQFESPSLNSPEVLASIECQLVYGRDLMTPWTVAGRRCGSVSIGLGCRGIRFRMATHAAPFFECRYDIAFIDGTRRLDVAGEDMVFSSSCAPVEAVRLHVIALDVVDSMRTNESTNLAKNENKYGGFNDSTIKLCLESPAFMTSAPNIRNRSTIPDEAWRAMDVSFSRGLFAASTITLRIIKNAIVMGEGIVFDQDGILVPGTNRLMSGDVLEQCSAIAKICRTSNIRRIAGNSLLCKTRAPENFGHFLVDMFPKAWLGAHLLPDKNITYIIHNTNILEIAKEALVRVGINPFAISVTDSQPVQCESLLFIDGLTNHGGYQSPIAVKALTELAGPAPPGPYSKIYVRRNVTNRQLLNQTEVERTLEDIGFAVVDPALMSLANQIALFKGAKTVVGALGAALTNIVFCPSGSKIVALTSQSFPDTFFWFISQHLKHEYQEVRGVDASGTPSEPRSWTRGFRISKQDLDYLATL